MVLVLVVILVAILVLIWFLRHAICHNEHRSINTLELDQ